MESMQKQLLELQRSDALQRAREQHDAIISALKQKHEKQVLSLEQNLDATKSALREQVRNYYRTLSALWQKLQNSTSPKPHFLAYNPNISLWKVFAEWEEDSV